MILNCSISMISGTGIKRMFFHEIIIDARAKKTFSLCPHQLFIYRFPTNLAYSISPHSRMCNQKSIDREKAFQRNYFYPVTNLNR